MIMKMTRTTDVRGGKKEENIMIEKIENYLKKDDFFGYQQVHEINTPTHRYVWGGCLVNKNTGVIDRYINKAGTAVGVVEYKECIFANREAYAIYIAGRFVGYITTDYKLQAPSGQGDGYWLNGIITSYEILEEQKKSEELKKAKMIIEDDEFFNDNDRD